MSRYAIKNQAGLFYSGNLVVETKYEPIPGNPTVAAPRSFLAPLFETIRADQGLKYETAEDAAYLLAHPDLHDPRAFDGCVVCECDFDRHDPQAVRPIT
jgi:hypothetical protein